MLNYFFPPEDNETNDSAIHKQIREQIKEPVDTEDDKPFSREEIASDGLTSEILLRVFETYHPF